MIKLFLIEYAIEYVPCRKFVRLGEHNLHSEDDGPVEDIEVIKVTKHMYYDTPKHANDIAILTLARDVTFSGECFWFVHSKVRKISLYSIFFFSFLLLRSHSARLFANK